jgi:hypothetical protein
MAKSRRNNQRKENLNKYKNKQKLMSQNAALAQSMPPVRSVPIWPADAKIDVTGVEWEAILNTFSLLQNGVQAVQSVMSRNLVNGTMTMDFEKLNPQTLQYEKMPDDEKAKNQAEFAEMIKAFKEQQSKPTQPVAEEQAPDTGLVDATGEPLNSPTAGKIINLDGTVVAE